MRPGGIKHIVDCEVPPDAYITNLLECAFQRRPGAGAFALGHTPAIAAFFDDSAVAGLSGGVTHAQITATKGVLPGNLVGRPGSNDDPDDKTGDA